MTRTFLLAAVWMPLAILSACHHADKGGDDDADVAPGATITPVTVTHPTIGSMGKTVEVSAISTYLLKTYVKASTGGYLKNVNIRMGDYVHKGEDLFQVETKEARSLGDAVTKLDTSLHFHGTIEIQSPGEGYITQLTYRTGDYVQDGEQVAVINDASSFAFLLNLPYELKPYIGANQNLQLHLPDGTVLEGYIWKALPAVDLASQTQPYVIKVKTSKPIPENLIAKVFLVEEEKAHTVSLPKGAVLSDDAQSRFWIMKMIDSTTAVTVPVKKGLENDGQVEILDPPLKASDEILLTGNYGLPDTAKVKVME